MNVFNIFYLTLVKCATKNYVIQLTSFQENYFKLFLSFQKFPEMFSMIGYNCQFHS